eukprot:Blabericola_migrator_1__4354@NODE_2340_length_2914_cov_14_294696_g1463_i0_p1_GENE_NODE_2340_length_2914_cov_14_294696_g1463_i0NODE_2340_length_2914_cov_14_294696_g1463_i0_p1_ORF_typecomplete_len338_score30_10_NODE_2340_length_2914_cov_14_294696_g1463_i018362849
MSAHDGDGCLQTLLECPMHSSAFLLSCLTLLAGAQEDNFLGATERFLDLSERDVKLINALKLKWDANMREYLSFVPFHFPNMTLRYHGDMQISRGPGRSWIYNTIAGAPRSVSDAWEAGHYSAPRHSEGSSRWWLSPITDTAQTREILTAAGWKISAVGPFEAAYFNLTNAYDVSVPMDTEFIRCETYQEYTELGQNLFAAYEAANQTSIGIDYLQSLPYMVTYTSTEERKFMEHYFAYHNNRFAAAFAVVKDPDRSMVGIYDLVEGLRLSTSLIKRASRSDVGDDLMVQILFQMRSEGYKFAVTRVMKNKDSLVKFLKSRWMILGPSNTYDKTATG